MHPKIEQALEEIDTAVFSGDAFDVVENLVKLLDYVERWKRHTSLPAPDPSQPWDEPAPISSSLDSPRPNPRNVGKPWHEFIEEAEPGMVIRLASDPATRILIGDVNENGGYCGDCSIGADDVVISVLDLRETIAAAMPDALATGPVAKPRGYP